MRRKRCSVEQIMAKLREAEVELSRGATAPEACRKIGVSTQTYYRWPKEYGGLKIDQAKRLKGLERENVRPKKLVAEQALDISMALRMFSDSLCQFRRPSMTTGGMSSSRESRFPRISGTPGAHNEVSEVPGKCSGTVVSLESAMEDNSSQDGLV